MCCFAPRMLYNTCKNVLLDTCLHNFMYRDIIAAPACTDWEKTIIEVVLLLVHSLYINAYSGMAQFLKRLIGSGGKSLTFKICSKLQQLTLAIKLYFNNCFAKIIFWKCILANPYLMRVILSDVKSGCNTNQNIINSLEGINYWLKTLIWSLFS